MAGTAFSQGRIEFIILRLGKTTDIMGLNEPVVDWTPDGKGINYTATFKLVWTDDRKKLIKII